MFENVCPKLDGCCAVGIVFCGAGYNESSFGVGGKKLEFVEAGIIDSAAFPWEIIP